MADTVSEVIDAHARPPEAPHRRWLWWLLGTLGVGLLIWGILYFGLDPWLKRRLEKAVGQQSDGRYALHVGALRTRLATGSVTLEGLRLRPTDQFRPGPDSLPKLTLDLRRFHLSGIDLLALWRKQPQRLDSLALSGLWMRIDSLPKTSFRSGRPLHERLPARVPGVQVAHLALREAQVRYMGRRRPRLAFRRLDLAGQNLRLDSTAAADTTRQFYAEAWRATLQRGELLFDHHRGRVKALDFDTQTGHVALDSLRIRPTRIGRRGPAYLTLRTGHIGLTGLRANGLPQKRFRADSLQIAGLYFDLTAPSTPPPPLHQVLAKVFRRLELTDMRLTDGFVRLRGVEHAPVIRQLRLHAENLLIDSATFLDPQRVLYARRWDGSTGAAQVPIEPPFYLIQYGGLAFDTRPGTLHVANLRLKPTMTLAAMARRKGHEVTQITLHVPTVRVSGADFTAFTREFDLMAQEIHLRTPRVFINGDSRYPISPQESIVTPEAVRKIPFRVDFRRVIVADCRIDFRFIGTTSPRYGVGRVTHLNGRLTNISNDPRRMTAATPLVAHATAVFQDQCRAEATAWMNLLDPLGRHQVKGTFGAAPVQILNPILEPSALTTLKTGTVQRIDLTMTADRTAIHGELRGVYQNLHIRLLNKKVEQTLLTKIKSKAANKLIIPDDNPDKPGQPLRVGRIESKRERRYSVFALWKQGLVSGALNAIGLSEEKAQKMSETQTEPGE